jgi:uncharacterized protein DUF3298/peptidoglycan-N-acetylmuramic acid deacetylase PdaC-like protein
MIPFDGCRDPPLEWRQNMGPESKNKRILIVLTVFLILFGGILGCPKKPSPPETRPAADFKTLHEETAGLKVDVKYPVTSNPTVNTALEGFAKDQVEEFKKDTGNSGPTFGMKNELTISYVPSRFSDSIQSFKFDVTTYTGGAHPNTAIFTKTFDLKGSKEIHLADIFKPDSNYLNTVSEIAVEDLKRQIQNTDLKWIRKGAGPEPENYKSFALTEKEILFFFDPYQVAPYSEGPQEVKIPYSLLKNLLQPPFEE